MGTNPDADVHTRYMHCLPQARTALIDGGAIAALLRVIVGAAEHEPESANGPTLTQMRRAQVCQSAALGVVWVLWVLCCVGGSNLRTDEADPTGTGMRSALQLVESAIGALGAVVSDASEFCRVEQVKWHSLSAII